MAYNTEVLRRARQRLEAAKADRESQYRERLQTVYAQLPRVRQIDIELRKSMVLATQAIFAGGENAQEAMEAVKQANRVYDITPAGIEVTKLSKEQVAQIHELSDEMILKGAYRLAYIINDIFKE